MNGQAKPIALIDLRSVMAGREPLANYAPGRDLRAFTRVVAEVTGSELPALVTEQQLHDHLVAWGAAQRRHGDAYGHAEGMRVEHRKH